MSVRNKTGSIRGFIAGGLLSVFGKSPAKPTVEDFRRAEFKTSTQRLGIRFAERIRNVFRFRWLRVSKSKRTHVKRGGKNKNKTPK